MLDQKFNKDFKNGPYVKIFLKNNDFKKRNDDFINEDIIYNPVDR